MHLLIPFASSSAPECDQALSGLRLPRLEQLLRRLELADTDVGSQESLTPPHERALAHSCGMSAPDGCIAWAAREAATAGRDPGGAAWAWITPAHWRVGGDHIVMADPRTLDLDEAQSRSLLAAMQPYFSEDGIALEYAAPQRWLARGAVFAGMPSASVDRVAGREVSAWLPSVARVLRLQNEMQMLLYTHPVNDARSARGAATVNSLWFSGTGTLPAAAHRARTTPPGGQSTDDPVLVDTLRDAAIGNDWAAWAQAWVELDRNQCQHLLDCLQRGEEARLTLSGERGALRFDAPTSGLMDRLRRRFKRLTLQSLRGQL